MTSKQSKVMHEWIQIRLPFIVSGPFFWSLSLLRSMPACTYRGVRYDTPARLSKELVLRYERKLYAERLDEASKDVERTYRGIRY